MSNRATRPKASRRLPTDVPPHADALGEPLMTAREVARHLGIHVASVYRLAGAANGLPVVLIGRGIRRFRVEDVRRFVASRTQVARPTTKRGDRLLGALPPPGPGRVAAWKRPGGDPLADQPSGSGTGGRP